MVQQRQFDYLFKIVIVGDSGVGKTNLLSKYAHNSFQESTRATIGVELLMHTFEIEGKLIQTQIWDTAGQERFRAIAATYYRNAMGAIVVFDLTKTQSFLHLTNWLTQIRSYSQPDISILVIGNKSDLASREVKQESIQYFIHKNNLNYIQTSARDGTNVEKAFMTLMEQVYQRQKKNESGKRKSDKTLVSNSLIIDKNNNKSEQKRIKIKKEKKEVVKKNCC